MTERSTFHPYYCATCGYHIHDAEDERNHIDVHMGPRPRPQSPVRLRGGHAAVPLRGEP
jgi:hypothetical protein